MNTRFGHPTKFSGAVTIDDVEVKGYRYGGMIIPSATTVQIAALTASVDGTMVYDSDIDAVFVRSAGAWVHVGTGAAVVAGGSDTHVQYNKSGVIAGHADLSFADGTGVLTVGGGVLTNAVTSKASGNSMGIYAGDVTTGTGGLLTALGGSNTSAADGGGGQLYLRGGSASAGGTAELIAGNLDGEQGAAVVCAAGIVTAGGALTLAGGAATGTANGGNVTIQAGPGGPTAGGDCGTVLIDGNSGAGGADGNVHIATRGITYKWPFDASAPSVGDIMVVSAVNGSTVTLELSSAIQAQIDTLATDLTTAEGAIVTAQAAADNAQTDADTAQTAADDAQADADTAQTAADNAQTSADNAQTSADAAQDNVASMTRTVTENYLPINGASLPFPNLVTTFNATGNISYSLGVYTLAANAVYTITYQLLVEFAGTTGWMTTSLNNSGGDIGGSTAGVLHEGSNRDNQAQNSSGVTITYDTTVSPTTFTVKVTGSGDTPKLRRGAITIVRIK